MKLKFIKLTMLTIASLIGIATFTTAPVFADSVCDSSAAESVKSAAGCPGYETGDKLPGTIQSILNVIISVAGIIAVIFVIVGGVQYMTSSGDPGKTKKAKDTILYAVIGLIVCALAFAIVNFVIIKLLGNET